MVFITNAPREVLRAILPVAELIWLVNQSQLRAAADSHKRKGRCYGRR